MCFAPAPARGLSRFSTGAILDAVLFPQNHSHFLPLSAAGNIKNVARVRTHVGLRHAMLHEHRSICPRNRNAIALPLVLRRGIPSRGGHDYEHLSATKPLRLELGLYGRRLAHPNGGLCQARGRRTGEEPRRTDRAIGHRRGAYV